MMDIITQFKGTVFEKGYGLIPQAAMRDKRLSAPAKAIYAYMCAFAGSGTEGLRKAYPGVEIMCTELEMSENTFYKHRKILIENGYIKIEKQRQAGSQFANNVYDLCLFPKEINLEEKEQEPYPKNSGMADEPHRNSSCMENPRVENPRMENSGAISISSTSISSINNSLNKTTTSRPLENQSVDAFLFWQENIGILSSFIQQSMIHAIDEMSEPVVVEAIKTALKGSSGQVTWNYVEGILRKWRNANVKTVEEAVAYQLSFQQGKERKATGGYRKQPTREEKNPEWYGKEEKPNDLIDEDAEFLKEKAAMEAELRAREAAKEKLEALD